MQPCFVQIAQSVHPNCLWMRAWPCNVSVRMTQPNLSPPLSCPANLLHWMQLHSQWYELYTHYVYHIQLYCTIQPCSLAYTYRFYMGEDSMTKYCTCIKLHQLQSTVQPNQIKDMPWCHIALRANIYYRGCRLSMHALSMRNMFVWDVYMQAHWLIWSAVWCHCKCEIWLGALWAARNWCNMMYGSPIFPCI